MRAPTQIAFIIDFKPKLPNLDDDSGTSKHHISYIVLKVVLSREHLSPVHQKSSRYVRVGGTTFLRRILRIE